MLKENGERQVWVLKWFLLFVVGLKNIVYPEDQRLWQNVWKCIISSEVPCSWENGVYHDEELQSLSFQVILHTGQWRLQRRRQHPKLWFLQQQNIHNVWIYCISTAWWSDPSALTVSILLHSVSHPKVDLHIAEERVVVDVQRQGELSLFLDVRSLKKSQTVWVQLPPDWKQRETTNCKSATNIERYTV